MARKVEGQRNVALVLPLVLLPALGCSGRTQGQVVHAASQPQASTASGPGADAGATRRERVGARGRIEPRGEVIDVGAPTGDRLARLEVEEGDTVEPLAILAYLQSHDERLAEVQEAQARVDQVHRLRPLEVQEQEAQVKRLEAELDGARKDHERHRGLGAAEVSRQVVDRQALLVASTAETLAGARVTLERIRQSAAVDRALAEAQLARARARLEVTLIRAPSAGRVLKILTFPGERISDDPILKLGNTRELYVLAEVYETDALLVTPGQRAVARSASLRAPLEGTVERVSNIVYKANIFADDPTAATDARIVETWIRLAPSQDAERLVHMRVDVEIDLGERS